MDTTTGSAPITVAFNTASMETEHSGRTMSKENEKNWTPSNMIAIDGGRLSASPDFWGKKNESTDIEKNVRMRQFYIERNNQLAQCDKAKEASHCHQMFRFHWESIRENYCHTQFSAWSYNFCSKAIPQLMPKQMKRPERLAFHSVKGTCKSIMIFKIILSSTLLLHLYLIMNKKFPRPYRMHLSLSMKKFWQQRKHPLPA